ncbi:MAG TPA: nitrate- and nitrite sensing domain-containing protein [Trebonia sp.]|nr:nitrate- and nitrite sensing domain-containing protein [Trebonia sp.]
MTNGDGGSETPASGLPRGGAGGSLGGPLGVGQGQGGPGAGSFGGPGDPGQGPGDPGQGPGGPGGQPGSPVPVSAVRRGAAAPAGGAGGPAAQVQRGSRFSLSNWRVRWRLIAIIAVPTVTAMILGGIQIGNSVSNYVAFQRVQTLANLNALVVHGAAQLADERDDMAGYVASGRKNAQMLAAVNKDQVATSSTLTTVEGQADAVAGNGSYRQQTVLDLKNGVLAGVADLTFIRKAALTTQYPPLAVIQSYDRLVTAFDTFSNDIAAGSGNATLQTDNSVLNALLRMEDDASLQRAYLYQALASTPANLTPVALADLNQAFSQQQADTSQFNAAASVAEAQTLNNTVAGPQVDEAQSAEKRAIASAAAGPALTIGTQQSCGTESPAQCWFSTQGTQIQDMRSVSDQLVSQITAQANSLVSTSLRDAVIISVATLILLLLVLLITTFVARSMIRPLRKLRADALEVAGSKLPDMVRRLSESEGGDESVEIEPIGVTSTDEIGEVARAFDQVHREAVRLAADEAMLRGNLNAMFVNLSRRSQSLIERQLTLIDNLEQSEQDADRLSSLFRLDHLATRMRRNSENLLVLAGHEASRRWSQPVSLVDVLRAAISEIEQYERVVLNVQPGIQVVGQAVNDVVHLVAEIVENATTFSPEDTQVYVTGQPLTSGGVLLDITDNGVGISEQEMAHANWRLDNPPVVDVAVSRRMGLFVVGRLAARHGVRVRLRHAQSGGLTALIWLPESVAAPESAQPLGRLRKFEADDYGPAPSLSAPTPAAGPGVFGGPFGLPGGGPGSGGNGGNGELGGGPFGTSASQAAAAAARIPRFSGPANGGGDGNGGGFPAFGNGAASGGPGGSGTVDAPGAPLPTRQPGGNGMQPGGGSPGNGGGSAFSGSDIGGNDFGAARIPSFGSDGGSAGTGPLPTLGGPGGTGPSATTNGVSGSDGSQVTVPPSVGTGQDQRLPIFDSLESDWFRRSGTSLSSSTESASASASASAQTWNSPADEGWRAARVAAAPEAGETTTAGLPKRVPRANLVPGSVGGGDDSEVAPPVRSADTVRNRMASFQRGVREARTAAPQNEEP